MPTSLVTGASGFIGPRLVARLQRAGRDVVCLVRKTSNTDRLKPLGVRFVTGDVTDPASLPPALGCVQGGVDEVYHLAGRLHGSTLGEFLDVNERGAHNLAEACAAQPRPPVLVVASSLAAAGPSPADTPHTEAGADAPISKYGKSKLASERAARRFAGRVPTTIVRPPVVFGPGDKDGFLVFQGIKRTRLHPVPNRSGLPVSLIYADDLCEAFYLAAERGERLPASDSTGGDSTSDDTTGDKATGLYYATDPQPTTWAEAGRMAARGMGCRVFVLKTRKWPFLIPALVGDAIGKLTGKPSIFGMDKLTEATQPGWLCSGAKAQQQLGFAPAAPLEERYAQTAAWYRDAGWL
ncbi:MAG: NAD-dependent epimerase/dehydratase family protein [Planctomycetota bacterium]